MTLALQRLLGAWSLLGKWPEPGLAGLPQTAIAIRPAKKYLNCSKTLHSLLLITPLYLLAGSHLIGPIARALFAMLEQTNLDVRPAGFLKSKKLATPGFATILFGKILTARP